MILDTVFRRLAVACLAAGVATGAHAASSPASVPAEATASDDKETLPVTISAAPHTVVLGETIKFSGNSIAIPGHDGVTVTIRFPPGEKSPNGAVTEVLQTALDNSGAYTVDYTPKFAGEYQVDALAPDGQGQGQDGFRVESPAALSSDLADAVRQAIQDALDIQGILRRRIRELPPSPAKDDLQRQIDDLNDQVEHYLPSVIEAAPYLPQLVGISGDVPPDPIIVKDRKDLLDSLARTRDAHEQSKKVLQQIQQADVVCDNLEVVVEGFKWVSVLLNLAGGGGVMNYAKAFAKDLAASLVSNKVSAATGSDLTGFGAAEGTKNYDIITKIKTGENKIDKVLNKPALVSIANDIAGKAAAKVMGHYCQQFTGTVTGRMYATFSTAGGILWWKYAFDFKGRLSLHYPKDAKGENIRVKGRLEGYGYNFALWENALTAMSPGLMTSTVQKKIYIMPFAPHDDSAVVFDQAHQVEGSVFSQVVTPNSFFFDVNGSVDSDKSLTLEIGAARTDMNAKARVFVIYLPALSLIPGWTIYSLPYKPVHFVFERASDHGFKIPLHTEKKGGADVILGKQHFENERGSSEAKGKYTVDFEVCNPGC